MVENRDCENIRHLISLELDSEIHDQQRVQLESHLDHCKECREWERSLQSGLENFDSDFSEVSGELEDLIRQNLKTADLSDPEPEVTVSRHGGGVAASRLSLVLTLLSLTVVGYLMRSETSTDRFPVTAEISGVSLIERLGEATSISGTETVLFPLQVGETLTCKEGNARLADGKGFEAEILFDSVVALRSPRELQVQRGEARFFLSPGEGELKVITEEVEISVVGTEFLVRRWDKVGRTEVFVLAGEVMVQWGKRIPLPVRKNEWVEVSSRGFMFHSSREPVQTPSGDSISRPEAGIGGEQPDSERLFRDIPKSTVVDEEEQKPLDMPVLSPKKDSDPDGESD